MKVLLYIALCAVVLMNLIRSIEMLHDDSSPVQIGWAVISLLSLFATGTLVQF